MKICFITTWSPKFCGIATYTSFLSDGLLKKKDVRIDIITEKENPPVKTKKLSAHPGFDRKTEYAKDIIKEIDKIKPNIVHIQHEFGIFGNDFRLINLLKKIKARKIVTLHTICAAGQKKKLKDIELFNRQVAKHSDRVIVHQKPDKNVLMGQGVADKDITIITHGTKIMKKISRQLARKKLGFPKKIKIILLFGFLKKAKLSFAFVKALPFIFKNNPDTYMYIAGSKVQTDARGKAYINHIKGWLKKEGINKRVVFINKFIPEEEVYLYYKSSDIVVFPYDLKDWGASGAAHLGIGSKRPILISRIPKLDEFRENISEEISVLPHHIREWKRVTNRILQDNIFRKRIMEKTSLYAEKSSWKNIAEIHYQLYKDIKKS